MLVDIRSRSGRISSGLRSYVHRVRDLSFGRFRHHVRQVVVRVVDAPDGAVRECEIDVRLKDRRQVLARGRATDLYAAIRSAFTHAASAMARQPVPRRAPQALPAASN